MTVRDLSLMGATLANGGVHPCSGRRVLSRAVARQTMSVMAGCGMYDAAGRWLTTVGIPAKSGVAGGLLGALPGQCGIAVLSPRLDDHGNSVRGVEAFRRMSADMGMHLVDAEPYGATVVRDVYVVDDATVFVIQGTIQFGGAESILHAFESDDTATPAAFVDATRIDHLSDVAVGCCSKGCDDCASTAGVWFSSTRILFCRNLIWTMTECVRTPSSTISR